MQWLRNRDRSCRALYRAVAVTVMFSCKSRYACGKAAGQHSDSDEDSSYGFKVSSSAAVSRNRTRAVLLARGYDDPDTEHPDYHIYGNLTFGYKPILKTRLSSAASSVRRRAPVKRTVSFSGVASSACSPDVVRRRSLRPPPPCYSVAVRRAASFSATRRSAAEIVARRQRMPLPHECVTSPQQPPLQLPGNVNTSRVVVDVHHKSTANCPQETKRTPLPSTAISVSTSV